MRLSGGVSTFVDRPGLFAKLTTLMKDGSPHTTPIWYMYDGGQLIVNTTRERQKFKNIQRDDRVALLIDDGYSYVLFRGRARVADERDAKKDIESLAVRYQGEEKGRKAARVQFWKQERVSLEIVPEKVVSGL